MAGETIEFANPVIGISEPAPANFPILLNMFKLVNSAEMPIKTIETTVEAEVWSRPLYMQKFIIICPIEHIKPPTQNALKQFFKIGELGDFLST